MSGMFYTCQTGSRHVGLVVSMPSSTSGFSMVFNTWLCVGLAGDLPHSHIFSSSKGIFITSFLVILCHFFSLVLSNPSPYLRQLRHPLSLWPSISRDVLTV
ncbi:hypothetical protein HOY80DRAFT_988139 [Tuber brumale]|nr:hypothetical protein HOY80DRAFT_988139 [Tuber brumale]